MPKRGDRKKREPLGDLSDPRSLASLHAGFLDDSRVRGYREGTVMHRDRYIRVFVLWCAERGITRAIEVSKAALERYQRHLFHYRRPNGEPLSFQTQYSHLSPLKMFFKWLACENHILYDPASGLELPRRGHRLPKHVLTASEAERVMTQPDLARTVGLRDRAILELLYSTGLRRTELIRLELWDIDCEHQTLLVRQLKGRRDRRIPIGSRAAAWLAKYLADVRPELVTDPSQRSVFLTREGFPLVPDHLTKMVHDYVQAAGIGKQGSCHMFRHTMAILMLEGGAGIRFIHQMLGHAVLSTTHTQVSMRELQQVHAMTHPAERGRSERLTAGQESGTALRESVSSFDADAGKVPL